MQQMVSLGHCLKVNKKYMCNVLNLIEISTIKVVDILIYHNV